MFNTEAIVRLVDVVVAVVILELVATTNVMLIIFLFIMCTCV